jgi:predicted anti-sigma-YlaC factor YlaD
MDCAQIRDALLEELPDEPVAAPLRRSIEAHAADCADCRRLRDALTLMDDGLSRHFRPPVLDRGFRDRLDARLTDRPGRLWEDWLPAAVHFASCGVATIVCVAVLPDAAILIVAAAAGITLVSHFLLTTAHSALDAAGD